MYAEYMGSKEIDSPPSVHVGRGGGGYVPVSGYTYWTDEPPFEQAAISTPNTPRPAATPAAKRGLRKCMDDTPVRVLDPTAFGLAVRLQLAPEKVRVLA